MVQVSSAGRPSHHIEFFQTTSEFEFSEENFSQESHCESKDVKFRVEELIPSQLKTVLKNHGCKDPKTRSKFLELRGVGIWS